MPFLKGLIHLVLGMTLLGSVSSWAQELALHYFPRPPYVFEKDGELAGLTGSPVVHALRRAGIAFAWHQTPASRFFATLQRGEGLDCGIGWFRNSEREAMGKFSKPIYQDEGMAVVTYAGHAVLRKAMPIEDLLSNRDLLFLAKQSFSYGQELDALIGKLQPQRDMVTTENLNMLRMLHAHRADYMLMAPEELTGAVAATGLALSDFTILRPTNMPKGELRYLWCSKLVPDAWIHRINSELR